MKVQTGEGSGRIKVLRVWQSGDYRCAVLHGPASINGYVAVPSYHPMHGRDAEECDVFDVHGGVNFAGSLKPWIESDAWWLGFDTAHAGDEFDAGPYTMPGHRWTEGEVAAECESLAEQLALYMDDVESDGRETLDDEG